MLSTLIKLKVQNIHNSQKKRKYHPHSLILVELMRKKKTYKILKTIINKTELTLMITNIR